MHCLFSLSVLSVQLIAHIVISLNCGDIKNMNILC